MIINPAGPRIYPSCTESAMTCLFRQFKRHTGTQRACWLPFSERAQAADLAVNAAEGLDLVESYHTIVK